MSAPSFAEQKFTFCSCTSPGCKHTYFCNCPQYLCWRRIPVECNPYTWSKNDVGSSKSTTFLSTFHIGSMFCFFPANFTSCTDKNNMFLDLQICIPNLELFPNRVLKGLFRTSFPKIGETFSLPDRRWNSQNFWRRSSSEYPPESWTTQTEEKNKKLFWENQTGFHYFHETHLQMMVKQEMNFGPFQRTSFTVITLNRESNCTYREKNHSQFHFDTLT